MRVWLEAPNWKPGSTPAPQGTHWKLSHRSPFHVDIFRSYSWSVNICGRKKWLLFPPGQEEALRDKHGSLPYDVTCPELTDTRLYPTHLHSSPPLEITQEAGEMLFVPSGWHHQVHNLVRQAQWPHLSVYYSLPT